MNIRISAQQKNAMLMMHFIELKHGLHTPVHTSYLRKQVTNSLCRDLAPNHFLVSLRRLSKNGYLVYQPNTGKQLNSSARENESMWQLTAEGRAYAEALYSTRSCPKRAYRKVSKKSHRKGGNEIEFT